MVKKFFKTVAQAVKVKRTGLETNSYFETEITIAEKALNVFFELGVKRDSEVQKPHIVVHDQFFELKFFLIEKLGHAVFYRIPLHVSELVVIGEKQYANIELAGKISIIPGSSRRLFLDKVKQGVCNSKYGRHKLLSKVAESVEHLKYRPAFQMFGDEIRPISLQLDLGKLLRQHQVAATLLDYGITNIVGISGLREEEGKFVISLSVGKYGRGSQAKPNSRQNLFNVT